MAQLLTRLPSREFWSKHRGHSTPAHQRTFDVPDPVYTHELKERLNSLIDASGQRYGRLKSDAQKDYARKYPSRYSETTAPKAMEIRKTKPSFLGS